MLQPPFKDRAVAEFSKAVSIAAGGGLVWWQGAPPSRDEQMTCSHSYHEGYAVARQAAGGLKESCEDGGAG